MTLLSIDWALVNWSRAQFALTAMYHWIFVPITLGILFIIAFMETRYVRTGDPEWKRITKFWMKLFGINFALGVATGLILEFEFGTNWSTYSWFVGDIFGAPLAIEGIMAFFMESTFIAVMFFGWNKVSKKFHLTATWLTALGANLSALWILVANGWMQFPVGMEFNPDTARNEMVNFWDVFLSPVAINKFLHTITSGYVLASIFVIGVSSWFLLKKREQMMAKKSIIIASVFGFISLLAVIFTGHGSAQEVAEKQPMKLAAMEGLYQGSTGADLIGIGILNHKKEINDGEESTTFKISFPKILSWLSFGDTDAFVPGIEDLINGNEKYGIMPAQERMARGDTAILALKTYKEAQKSGDKTTAAANLDVFRAHYDHFGYGYIEKEKDLIPHVPLVFYSFHYMVATGFLYLLLFLVFLWLTYTNKIETIKWRKPLFILGIAAIPMVFITSEAGWIVVEVGRQPWVVQDLMPVSAGVTNISANSVQITFWIFAVIFTALLIAELNIMFRAIKKGPAKSQVESKNGEAKS
ncbi:MAG: cytochrome ubiquinol oxidase subunit I [Candidatus Delongbacteria bacterium]|jgi:cytochrome d ubiquinol oxidase subunit I|nr:cytochrome ubiquinol oxidase subunit I [Candidatus Delongbacteria bacterium]